MSPLRLTLVARHYWPAANGPQQALAELARAWAAFGAEVTVLTPAWHPQWPRLSWCDGVRVVRLPFPPLGFQGRRRWLKALTRWLRDQAAQIDLALVSGMRQEAPVVVAAGEQAGFPVALRPELAGEHGDVIEPLLALGGRRLRRACARAAALIASTPALARELIAAGYDRGRIHELPAGVPAAPERSLERRAAARLDLAHCDLMLAVPEDTPVAVACGPLAPHHGLDLLLSLWPRLVERVPAARLWLVGEGPLADNLPEYNDRWQLYGRVYAPGLFDDPEEFFLAADLFLAPSPEHGFAYETQRAMACAAPVLAADIAGNRDLLTDGATGRLLPRDDSEAWLEALVHAFQHPAETAAWGRRGAESVRERFPLAKMAQQYLELFDRLRTAR